MWYVRLLLLIGPLLLGTIDAEENLGVSTVVNTKREIHLEEVFQGLEAWKLSGDSGIMLWNSNRRR